MLLANRDRKLIAAIHACQRYRQAGGLGRVALAWAKLRHVFWSLATASDIHREARIAADLRLPHPNGVVMHRNVEVAEGCLIMQQVTLGEITGNRAPRIGRRVYIGAGAKVLGDVTIGDDARIGANAVVLENVPANATAVGVPATWKIRDTD